VDACPKFGTMFRLDAELNKTGSGSISGKRKR
jgi:hypothetical protein